MSVTVAMLELQVWASRALIAAGFPGGAVDQAARLVAQAQLVDEHAAAGFVADLPAIAARDHGTPRLGEGGRVDAGGLHALAVAPGVLDLACAEGGDDVFRVTASGGAWVLPGVALHGARRGRAVLAAGSSGATLAWPEPAGPALAFARPARAAALIAAAGVAAQVPADGYVIASVAVPDHDTVATAAEWIMDAAGFAAHVGDVTRVGFAMPREVWDGITGWGWKMLVPTSDRSKSQAGGDMGEG